MVSRRSISNLVKFMHAGGMLRVADPPKPEWSNPTLLTDEIAAFDAQRKTNGVTFLEGDEHTPSGFWTVIDTEICDGPFATEQAAHDFAASR